MAPFAAAGEPGHRAGHPGGTDLVGWAQAAAGAQREVARQHWTSGHKISWASGCPVPPSPGEPLTVPAHSGHLRWLNWGEEGFLEEVTRNRGPLMGWPLAPGQLPEWLPHPPSPRPIISGSFIVVSFPGASLVTQMTSQVIWKGKAWRLLGMN